MQKYKEKNLSLPIQRKISWNKHLQTCILELINKQNLELKEKVPFIFLDILNLNQIMKMDYLMKIKKVQTKRRKLVKNHQSLFNKQRKKNNLNNNHNNNKLKNKQKKNKINHNQNLNKDNNSKNKYNNNNPKRLMKNGMMMKMMMKVLMILMKMIWMMKIQMMKMKMNLKNKNPNKSL